jgi:hypothetical protein
MQGKAGARPSFQEKMRHCPNAKQDRQDACPITFGSGQPIRAGSQMLWLAVCLTMAWQLAWRQMNMLPKCIEYGQMFGVSLTQ